MKVHLFQFILSIKKGEGVQRARENYEKNSVSDFRSGRNIASLIPIFIPIFIPFTFAFATWWWKLFWSNIIHSFKYPGSTTFGYKDIVIRKSEFVAKTQFLSGLFLTKPRKNFSDEVACFYTTFRISLK